MAQESGILTVSLSFSSFTFFTHDLTEFYCSPFTACLFNGHAHTEGCLFKGPSCGPRIHACLFPKLPNIRHLSLPFISPFRSKCFSLSLFFPPFRPFWPMSECRIILHQHHFWREQECRTFFVSPISTLNVSENRFLSPFLSLSLLFSPLGIFPLSLATLNAVAAD